MVREASSHEIHPQDTDPIIPTTVINPAERNAIVGIKPTVGLTSRAGYATILALGHIG